tara:strand:- start:2895 stop:3626 length:732 start_codon:yes stop_codon:yes gene_type:complete
MYTYEDYKKLEKGLKKYYHVETIHIKPKSQGNNAVFILRKNSTSRQAFILKAGNKQMIIEDLKHKDILRKIPSRYQKYFVQTLNIPFESSLFPNFYFFQMEYIKGTSLYSLLKKNELNQYQIEMIQDQLKRTLLTLWKIGYIHNDLHLSNIMVINEKTPQVQIKIIDFGHAVKVDPMDPHEQHPKKWYKKMLKKYNISTSNPNYWILGKSPAHMYAKHHKQLLKDKKFYKPSSFWKKMWKKIM